MRRQGQSLAEYVLILALVSIVSITVLSSLGQNNKATFTKVVNALNSTNTPIATTVPPNTGKTGSRAGSN